VIFIKSPPDRVEAVVGDGRRLALVLQGLPLGRPVIFRSGRQKRSGVNVIIFEIRIHIYLAKQLAEIDKNGKKPKKWQNGKKLAKWQKIGKMAKN
jgi:hypothetical protein